MRGQIHRRGGPAVVGVAQRNDVHIFRVLPPGEHRQLVGFGAAVGEVPARQPGAMADEQRRAKVLLLTLRTILLSSKESTAVHEAWGERGSFTNTAERRGADRRSWGFGQQQGEND